MRIVRVKWWPAPALGRLDEPISDGATCLRTVRFGSHTFGVRTLSPAGAGSIAGQEVLV